MPPLFLQPTLNSTVQARGLQPCGNGLVSGRDFGRRNGRVNDTILTSISRSTHRPSATELFIDISTPEAGGTGLRQNSMIQCENLLTYDPRLVITKVGQLSAPLMQRVNACIKAALDLS